MDTDEVDGVGEVDDEVPASENKKKLFIFG